jgi:hypothetical protein
LSSIFSENKNVILHTGRGTMSHGGGRGAKKRSKKCHVLFEWPLALPKQTLNPFKGIHWITSPEGVFFAKITKFPKMVPLNLTSKINYLNGP